MDCLEPPVNPFSEPGEIRRWIARLYEVRDRYADDPRARALIMERLRDAEGWLKFRGYGDGRDRGSG